MRQHPSRPFVRIVAALGVAALAVSACGGGDDDEVATTSAPTTDPTDTTTATTAPSSAAPATTDSPSTTSDDAVATTEAPTTTSGDDENDQTSDDQSSDDDMIIVDNVDDLPAECVDLLADFLKVIEPAVRDIDWDTATLGDFQAISDELESQFTDMDAREIELGCDNYDLSTDAAAMEAAIEIAEQEAPGAVGWLEFLGALTAEQPSGDDSTLDCEGAIAYIDDLIAQGLTMTDVPFSEVNLITQAFNVISTECPPEQSAVFFAREDVSIFSS